MENLLIEEIYNKNDAYLKKLTASNKQTIFKFFKEHKAELKEQNIDFLVSEQFFHCVDSVKYRDLFKLLIDALPQSLIQKFFNEIINYSEFSNYYYTVFQSVSVDELFVESDVVSGVLLIEDDIRTLKCKFYHKKDLKKFLKNCKEVNIQRLIIDEPFNLDKEDIEKLLSTNGSSAKEIIFKK